MNLGDQITKKLTSGRFFVQFPGDPAAQFRDLGNVDEYKWDPKINRKEHMASAAGVRQVDLSLASEINGKFSVTLTERLPDLDALYVLGTQGADAVQGGGNIVAESLTTNSQQGRTYFTLNQGLSAVVVKVGGIAQVLGTDYVLDLGSGAITILNGGGIENASTVTCNYTAAAVTNHTFTAFTQLLQLLNFKLIEKDQFNVIPREVWTGKGQFYVTNWGENKGDYNKAQVELLVYGQPNVNVRAD